MKKILLLLSLAPIAGFIHAQNYPEPEFSNELYYLSKDSVYKLSRLEKATSEQNITSGMLKGSETSYNIEGTKSHVRLERGNQFSFVISTGASASSSSSDSAMRANGVDPSMLKGLGSTGDPAQTITLYKLDIGKGERKVILQKVPGANPFGKHKIESSDKYTFSAKRIKDGYWELIVDKPLPKGEYAFTMNPGGYNMMGDVMIFAFGVD